MFANRRDQVRSLYEKLRKGGISCGILSGEITQAKRTRTLADFKSGKIKVLVATDVAGRGIRHVDGVSHVVNYNLPEDPEDYVHRIGRTGRAGATGISISFASEDDAFLLPDIETLLGERLKCVPPPQELLDDFSELARAQFLTPQQGGAHHRRGNHHQIQQWNARHKGHDGAETQAAQATRGAGVLDVPE